MGQVVCAGGGQEEEPGEHDDKVAFAEEGQVVAIEEEGGDGKGGQEKEGDEKDGG